MNQRENTIAAIWLVFAFCAGIFVGVFMATIARGGV
jgi:uncharacterized protein YneF (UPF0154 family)